MTVGSGDANEHVIEATLTADGDETVLVIEVRGVPLKQVAGYGSGWQVHVEEPRRLPRRAGALRHQGALGRAHAGL